MNVFSFQGGLIVSLEYRRSPHFVIFGTKRVSRNSGITNFETLFSAKSQIGSKDFLKSTFLANFSFFESGLRSGILNWRKWPLGPQRAVLAQNADLGGSSGVSRVSALLPSQFPIYLQLHSSSAPAPKSTSNSSSHASSQINLQLPLQLHNLSCNLNCNLKRNRNLNLDLNPDLDLGLDLNLDLTWT